MFIVTCRLNPIIGSLVFSFCLYFALMLFQCDDMYADRSDDDEAVLNEECKRHDCGTYSNADTPTVLLYACILHVKLLQIARQYFHTEDFS